MVHRAHIDILPAWMHPAHGQPIASFGTTNVGISSSSSMVCGKLNALSRARMPKVVYMIGRGMRYSAQTLVVVSDNPSPAVNAFYLLSYTRNCCDIIWSHILGFKCSRVKSFELWIGHLYLHCIIYCQLQRALLGCQCTIILELNGLEFRYELAHSNSRGSLQMNTL